MEYCSSIWPLSSRALSLKKKSIFSVRKSISLTENLILASKDILGTPPIVQAAGNDIASVLGLGDTWEFLLDVPIIILETVICICAGILQRAYAQNMVSFEFI